MIFSLFKTPVIAHFVLFHAFLNENGAEQERKCLCTLDWRQSDWVFIRRLSRPMAESCMDHSSEPAYIYRGSPLLVASLIVVSLFRRCHFEDNDEKIPRCFVVFVSFACFCYLQICLLKPNLNLCLIVVVILRTMTNYQQIQMCSYHYLSIPCLQYVCCHLLVVLRSNFSCRRNFWSYRSKWLIV